MRQKTASIYHFPPIMDTSVSSDNAAQVSVHITLAVFPNAIPAFVETELIRLYGNLFSSMDLFIAFGMNSSHVHTYVEKTDGENTAIILFQVNQSNIQVLNEQIFIPEEKLKRFTSHLFKRYKGIHSITFKAIATDMPGTPALGQRVSFTNDVVVQLPTTPENYLAAIGKSTRDNIKRYLKVLKRDFPTFQFQVHGPENTTRAQFLEIIRFNHERMVGKNKVPGTSEKEVERLYALFQRCGLLATVTIDGCVCAGTICYQVGDNYFMRVIAHDPHYNDYRLGVICCYLSVCDCIARGGKHYHMLWGQEEYKYRLMGQQRNFDTITFYRSRVSYLLNLRKVIQVEVRRRMTQLKSWLLDPKNQGTLTARTAQTLMKIKRTLKNRHG
jgi:hypothetical protein